MKKLFRISFLGLVSLSLAAQAPEPGPRFGISLGAALTTGQVRDFNNKTRVDLGFHVTWCLEGGHAFRGSVHALEPLGSRKTREGGVEVTRTLRGAQAMGEYLWYPGGTAGLGFYLSPGLAVDAERCTVKGGGRTEAKTVASIVPSVEFGYDFDRRLGVSLRYVHGFAEPKDAFHNYGNKELSAGTLSAGLRFTF